MGAHLLRKLVEVAVAMTLIGLSAGCAAPDGRDLYEPSESSGLSARGGSGAALGGGGGFAMGGAGGRGGGSANGGSSAVDPRTARDFGIGKRCPALDEPMITDFDTTASIDGASFRFGDDTRLSGTLFAYPTEPNAYPLRSQVTAGEWRLSGAIGDYAGFGLALDCNGLDASRYAGFSFTLRARVDAPGGLRMIVTTAENEVSHVWLNAHKTSDSAPDEAANFGVCVPEFSQYDGTCAPASMALPTGNDELEMLVRWSEFSGGSPERSVDPASITSIVWQLTAPPNVRSPSVQPYEADIRIDELSFEPR